VTHAFLVHARLPREGPSEFPGETLGVAMSDESTSWTGISVPAKEVRHLLLSEDVRAGTVRLDCREVARRKLRAKLMPELFFKGKEFVYNHHLAVPYRPLVPDAERSIGEPRLDGNLIIHGDNLHALKSLLPLYAGKVDCIFIDPPYNTGNEGWCYNDNVNSPMIREWLSSNPVGIEDGLRHDKWLAMMWPRLRLLGELLSDCGTIAVCTDDNEFHRLRTILDETFGEEHFLGIFCWKTRNTDNRVKSKLSVDHEYVLVYSRGEGLQGRIIDRSDFSNPDDDPRGEYVTDPLTGKATRNARPNLHYDIINPITGDLYPPDPARGWITDEAGFETILADNRIWWPPNPRTGKPRKKRFLSETEERMPESSFWSDIKGQSGADELDKIMGARRFDFPKAHDFVAKVLDLCSDDNSTILDSFAGSGTTAHAALTLTGRSGNRKFILVECENYADTLTAERVRRVINGYSFTGTQREELHRERLTFTSLKKADKLLAHWPMSSPSRTWTVTASTRSRQRSKTAR
jgi:adenine-specific DNA-methyltransferase